MSPPSTWKWQRVFIALLTSALIALPAPAFAQQPPPSSPQKPDLFLLKTYDTNQPQEVTGWVMSEKLDGVRGIWDGENLRTRSGRILDAPDWFLHNFPPFPLDGELWTARGDFENIVSIVTTHARTTDGKDNPAERWRALGYFIFEAPHQRGGLHQRLAVVEEHFTRHHNPHARVLPQIPVRNNAHLQKHLAEIIALGGEGLVVRNPTTPYQTGRLASALKVKHHQDAECTVRAILPGKGKNKGKMGALQCEMANGLLIKIGTGFSERERIDPPPVGSLITFKHYGFTVNGIPRFAVYLRRRTLQ